MNVLLIVDPQIDFISGSLAVESGASAMDWLAAYTEEHIAEIDHIVITMDQHPIGHCSFAAAGGPWPPHCVRYSQGAAIYPPLFDTLLRVKEQVKSILFIEKATTIEKDSYSAFEQEVPELLREADTIYVAGIAGDFCVKSSVEDLQKHGLKEKIVMLPKGIAYINGPE